MLPPFVRQQLDQIRDSNTQRGLPLPSCSSLTMAESKVATQKLHLLVPNEDKRKNYLRLFKWVVSFATWRYGADSTSSLGKGDGVDDAGYTLQVTFAPLTSLFKRRLLELGLRLCPFTDTRVHKRKGLNNSAVSNSTSS
jgi:hypothetical protein